MHCFEKNLTNSFVRFERPYNSPGVAFRWNRVVGTFQMDLNKSEVRQSSRFPLWNQYSSLSKCILPLRFAWSHGGQATQGRAAWGPLGAGVRGSAAVQPCRGWEPLLLSLHFALAGKMLKVNGEILLGVFGSLELLWLLRNQGLWRAKTQARKILGQIRQFSSTKQISYWGVITLLINELGFRSPWLHVGGMLSSKCSIWWAAEGRGCAERYGTLPSSDPAQRSSTCSLQLECTHREFSIHKWTRNISMAAEPTKSQRLFPVMSVGFVSGEAHRTW